MINITDKKSLEGAFAKDFSSPYFPILADLYLQEGDLRRAKIVCELGLKYSSGNDCGKFILAKVALAEEKFTLAERLLKQVIRDNPANFNALRILIRLEFSLNRNSKTIMKNIQFILQFLPNDVECLTWIKTIAGVPDNLPNDTTVTTSKDNEALPSNGSIVVEHRPLENRDYNMEESMATFSMLQILKSQKHYQQALTILNMMESKNMDADRISKERDEIHSRLSQRSKA